MKRRALLPVYVCAAVALATGHLAYAQDQVVTRVTDAMLQDPDPADWLSWRRTLDGWGVQPARSDRPEQRGRATARLVLGSPTRGVADDADRARRRHVCREPGQRGPGARRAHGRLPLGVSPRDGRATPEHGADAQPCRLPGPGHPSLRRGPHDPESPPRFGRIVLLAAHELPIKHEARLAKCSRNFVRDSRTFMISPVSLSTQCNWNTRFAMSTPTTVACWTLRFVWEDLASPLGTNDAVGPRGSIVPRRLWPSGNAGAGHSILPELVEG